MPLLIPARADVVAECNKGEVASWSWSWSRLGGGECRDAEEDEGELSKEGEVYCV